jgi:hypothetical protein
MSTATNTNAITKVYNMGGNELNSTVKGIIWNILDERPHKAYLNRTHETTIVRRQLLQILGITAGIHHQALAITNLSTNTYCAAVSLANPMKTFNVKAFEHISEMIRELSIASNINTENHAHKIAETVIDMLDALPNEGNQSEIKAANRMVKAYRNPTPTRPSTPKNIEMEPIPIPTPKPTRSAWQNTFQEIQTHISKANKESIPPANIATTSTHTNYPTNWNLPMLMHEVHHLHNYLTGVPPPTFPTIFKLTNNYVFLDHDESKTSRLSYWNLILSKFFNEGEKTDQYKAKVFRYVEAGVDNAKIFLGINDKTTTWYFAKDKRSLFNVIDGGVF